MKLSDFLKFTTYTLAVLLLAKTTNKAIKDHNVVELETLKIVGKIYEPQVLFILEQPAIDLITIEEAKRHDFLKNIEKTVDVLK